MAQTFFRNGRHWSLAEMQALRKKKEVVEKAEEFITMEETLAEIKARKENGECCVPPMGCSNCPSKEVEVTKLNPLEVAHLEFEKKEGKPVPTNKKNDLDWINKKLNS